VRHAALSINTPCVGGLSHLEIQNHPAVYELVRRIVAGEALDENEGCGP
jgi:hypothetical protein